MKHLIIGLGSIGRRHAHILLGKGQEVIGVDFNSANGFDFPVYSDIESGWEAEPDMAWICTPTHLHARQAVDALKRGLHIFIEKPAAHDLESAMKIQEEWIKADEKRLVWIGCNMRFHEGVMRLKQAVHGGVIGKPLVYRIHFSHYLPNMRPGSDYRQTYASHIDQGGGIVLDDIHDIDLALWFSGPVKKINSMSANSGTLNIGAEDISHISILHENGVFSEIHMDFLRRDKSRGIEVIGEKGTLEWRSLGKSPELAILNLFESSGRNVTQLWQEENLIFNNMFENQLNSVLKAVQNPEKYDLHLNEGLEVLKVAFKARGSSDCFN